MSTMETLTLFLVIIVAQTLVIALLTYIDNHRNKK